jgi:acetoacetate decarboxylase
MFLNDHPPIAAGRELWGFPRELAEPTLKAEIDTLIGELYYGKLRIAVATMGYKHKQGDLAVVKASLEAPNFLLKIIPHVDGTPRICDIVANVVDKRRKEFACGRSFARRCLSRSRKTRGAGARKPRPLATHKPLLLARGRRASPQSSLRQLRRSRAEGLQSICYHQCNVPLRDCPVGVDGVRFHVVGVS